MKPKFDWFFLRFNNQIIPDAVPTNNTPPPMAATTLAPMMVALEIASKDGLVVGILLG